MDSTPTVLIVSNSNTKPSSIIKLITKQPLSNNVVENILVQPWTIKTKYYITNINFVGFNESIDKLNKDASFMSEIEAFIIHMDTNKTTGLEELGKWIELMDELSIQPEIKILLANYCNDKTAISKDDVNVWSLDNGFEFVELFPTPDEQDDEDTLGVEKVGVERVIEALENNLWSNMEMIEVNNEESNNLEAETDNFMELFSNLMTMKNNLSGLPSNTRKQYAEQMVTAFWNAIGGDEDEIADL